MLEDGGPPLFQSLAILEYLEETRPQPALLPKDARGRARVRGLALIAAADGHPLVVPRIRTYLEKELNVSEEKRNRWLAHWSLKALEAIESHLKNERATGKFCHGDAVSIADICLAGQVIGATDNKGFAAIERVLSPENFVSTIYAKLGIDPNKIYYTHEGRPVHLVSDPTPIRELMG